MASEMRNLLDFAVDAAAQAEKTILRYYQTGVAVEAKADKSPVTIADREAEEQLRTLIQDQFPNDGIVGEEGGEFEGHSGRRWILDPIDGTKSFIHGVPLFGTLIGMEEEGRCVMGVANFPALKEMVYAARGEGCFWNGRATGVSEVTRMSESLLMTSDIPRIFKEGYGPGYFRACVAANLSRGWGDCYGHVLVATGRAEVMLDPVMNVWDSAALYPIVLEAGGTFTDWNGNVTDRGGSAISTNGKVYDELMGILKY